MYKIVSKTKDIRRYMEALALHNGSPTLHWEENKSFISVVEAKRVTPRVKKFEIPVCFLQYFFDNDLFIPRYETYSVMLADMCTKPCSGTILIWSTKWITGLRLYPTGDTEHYQLMILHEFFVN